MPTISTHHISTHSAGNSWSVEFDEPVVAGVPTAATMNAAIDALVQAWITDFTSHAMTQPKNPDGGIVPAVTYLQTLIGTYSVAFLSPKLISLRFALAYSAGGAHDIDNVGGISLRVANGAVIAFADLFSNAAAALTTLNTQTQALLTAQLGADGMTWSPAASLAKVSDAWAMTAGGLELSWNRGHVADEATGPVTITIPWTALAGVTNPTGPVALLH
jgi:hypothetical protein